MFAAAPLTTTPRQGASPSGSGRCRSDATTQRRTAQQWGLGRASRGSRGTRKLISGGPGPAPSVRTLPLRGGSPRDLRGAAWAPTAQNHARAHDAQTRARTTPPAPRLLGGQFPAGAAGPGTACGRRHREAGRQGCPSRILLYNFLWTCNYSKTERAKTKHPGPPWWPSGWDPELCVQGAQVWSPVRELDPKCLD